MQQTQAIRAAARKRDGVVHKQQGLGMRPDRAERESGHPDRKRVQTVVETLATLRGPGETLSEVAHDARNMVTALGLYCDLLEEPGVLATPFMHYGHELRLVAAASRRLVEKIVMLDAQTGAESAAGAAAPRIDLASSVSEAATGEAEEEASPICGRPYGRHFGGVTNPTRRWDLLPAVPVANLAAELLANRNLLAALAGPSIALTVDAEGGAQPVRLTGEDLTRVLVNLVKNSTEAMPTGGRIHLSLREQPAARGAAASLLLTVEDNGPGIKAASLETIFASGYTSHGMCEGSNGNWNLSHRGLGLTISRSIVEGAGGRITAGNREQGGARFSIELPLRKAS
jgi:signal transduction histidine kinase